MLFPGSSQPLSLSRNVPLSTDLGLSQRAFHTDAAPSAERLYLF